VDSDEAGHAFQCEAGRLFRREAGHPWLTLISTHSPSEGVVGDAGWRAVRTTRGDRLNVLTQRATAATPTPIDTTSLFLGHLAL
jgi:hypothetical protein